MSSLLLDGIPIIPPQKQPSFIRGEKTKIKGTKTKFEPTVNFRFIPKINSKNKNKLNECVLSFENKNAKNGREMRFFKI